MSGVIPSDGDSGRNSSQRSRGPACRIVAGRSSIHSDERLALVPCDVSLASRRSSFLDAAEIVLREINLPLSPSEIASEAQARRLITTTGLTPDQTMKAKLSTDVLRRREASRFMRTDPNRFALREWIDTYPEYVADRFQKALLDEEVVVFPRDVLPKFVPCPGLHQIDDLISTELLQHCYAMQRRDAEEDFTVIQLVSAFLVRQGDKYATFKRTRRLPEARLHGVYSLLFGGHLNPDDVAPLFSIFDAAVGGYYIQRELEEELRFSRSPSLELVGVIYDTSREVSTQHLGVLYEVVPEPDTDIQIGERGFLQHLQFETAEQVRGRLADFENWSELVLYRHILSTPGQQAQLG